MSSQEERDGHITPCICGGLNIKADKDTQLFNPDTSNILQPSFPFIFFCLEKKKKTVTCTKTLENIRVLIFQM